MTAEIPVTVKVLEKEYRVACPENEKPALLEAAEYLDDKMQTLKNSLGVVGVDRLAVIAALNITNEMLQSQGTTEHLNSDIKDRLVAMGKKIEESLGHGDELDL